MANTQLIKDALVVNNDETFPEDVLIRGQIIERIATDISVSASDEVIDANGAWLLLRKIDHQVYFGSQGLPIRRRPL